jgi:hypothetical protein
MEKEIVSQAVNVLQAFADKIGMTVTQLWPYFIKQAYITSFEVFLCTLLSSIFSWFFGKKFFKAVYDYYNPLDGVDRNTYVLYFATYGAVMAISIFILFIALYTLCTDEGMAFLNPEYWAAMKLLKAVKMK